MLRTRSLDVLEPSLGTVSKRAPMKHGSVYQRHGATCPQPIDGVRPVHRCRGKWAYHLELGRDSNGQRVQVTKAGWPTRSAAMQALREATTTYMTELTVTGTTVGEYLQTWILSKHALRPKTEAAYRDIIAHYLVPGLGPIRLIDLRASHLDRFYAATTTGRRGTPLSPSSIRRIHAVLRSALGTAVKRRLIPYNPAEHIELAPEQPRRPRPWTAAECATFLRDHAGDPLTPLYRLIITTGMRRGEAVGLRWEDVDLDHHVLVVAQQITEVRGRSVVGRPKTKHSSRVVTLDPATTATLQAVRAHQLAMRAAWGDAWHETGLVFTREDGSAYRPEHVTRRFYALAAVSGLPAIRLHDLRHTNATLALSAGVPLKVVSERLGHSQTSITADLYTHVAADVSGRAAALIAGLLDEVPSRSLADDLREGR